MVDWIEIQNKWAKKWVEEKVFEPTVEEGKKKFFVNAPYPYVNSILHIGHLYTYMRAEAFARYKRMQGFNVLFPQGWHATGSPIVSAANRVKEKEEKQLELLKNVGVAEEDLVKFEDPEYWVNYFVPEAVKDFQAMGMSIDWSRQFYTTSLNPHYDKFIKWQFNTLKNKGYVVQGSFPVVWCPKDNNAVGDHSRAEGEGETPLEYLLVKHKLEDGRFVVSATLRPDTILGITNLYVNPETTYVEAKIKGERWILSEVAVKRLQGQGHNLVILGDVSGKELIGKKTEEFAGSKVLILPAKFVKPEFGTGLVHSVPSDSADDLIALWDLQKNEKVLTEFGLNSEEVKAIKPIAVLKTPGYSDIPAEDFLKKYKVNNQNDREKLDKIKKEMYKLSHHTSTLNELYKEHFSKDFSGLSVEEGKEVIKKELTEKGWVIPYYELTGKVVCRCLTECVVKIVEDQWFMNYGDKEWKKLVHKALDQLKLYPEKSRSQFEYVIDWLHNWACTRESGLGTRLPWDEKWLIESLSDSTIYMAYYTVVPTLKEVDISLIDDALFDYVFLGKDVEVKVDSSLASKMREEFNYWYPVDFRNSGKDLIQNHLTFFLFNHTGIFPEDKWPKGIGVNGWITVDGEKMSKSKGNIISLREMPEKFGVDCARFTILSSGEDMDDPNWDSAFATALRGKLDQFYDFCIENYGKGKSEMREIDMWMESELQKTILRCTEAMENTSFRTALQAAYFELTNAIKWYTRRCNGEYNKRVISDVIKAQVKMLAPFTPFLSEEIWEKIGGKGYCSFSSWPKYDGKKIEERLEQGEKLVKQVLQDVVAVMKLAKVEKVNKLKLFVAESWKYKLYKVLSTIETHKFGQSLPTIMQNAVLREHGKEVSKLVGMFSKNPSKFTKTIVMQEDEIATLEDAKLFLESEFNCNVEIIVDGTHQKAKVALPGKVGILVE